MILPLWTHERVRWLGAGGGNRTHTTLRSRDFESRASASFTTPAREGEDVHSTRPVPECGPMRYNTFAALLLVVAFAAACARDKGPTPAEAFRAQLDDDWKFWMAQYPEAATAVGYAGQNARWTDYSPAAIERRETYLKKSLMRVGSIDPGALPPADQLNYTLYKDLLQTAVDGLQFHNDALPIRGVTARNLMMPVNQMDGVQQDIPRVIASMPSASREDLENIIARLSGAGTLVDQTIALLEKGLAAGMTPPAITLRDLPGQARAQIVADPMQSPLLEAFKSCRPEIPEADGRLDPRPRRSSLRAVGQAGLYEAPRISRHAGTCPRAARRSGPTRCRTAARSTPTTSAGTRRPP